MPQRPYEFYEHQRGHGQDRRCSHQVHGQQHCRTVMASPNCFKGRFTGIPRNPLPILTLQIWQWTIPVWKNPSEIRQDWVLPSDPSPWAAWTAWTHGFVGFYTSWKLVPIVSLVVPQWLPSQRVKVSICGATMAVHWTWRIYANQWEWSWRSVVRRGHELKQ